jgi:hypothetical protein
MQRRYARFAPDGGFGEDIKGFAATLVALQNLRHLADYDPLFRPTKSNAAEIAKRSRDALARLRQADESLRKDFLTLVIFSPREVHQVPEI